jgi:ribonuclease R
MNEIEKCIIENLQKSSSHSLPLKTLKRKCGKNIKSTLSNLIKREILIKKRNKYVLPEKATYIRGIFDGKLEGYGFLMPDDEIKDLFISPKDTYTALDGDLVLAQKLKKSRGRWTARIVKILKREREFLVGEVVRENGVLMFKPHNRNIPYLFEIGNTKKVKESDWILVKFLKWTTPSLPPLVKFVKKIRKENIHNVIVKQEFNLKHGFPGIIKKELKNIPHFDFKGRKDLTKLKTITIDPEDAKDLDDAISISKVNNRLNLWVHIADVSSVVNRGSNIDKEAYERALTTYLPEDTYFMLPKDLTDILSLDQGKKCPTITVEILFDKKGNQIKKDFYKSITVSDKKFSYKETQKIVDGKINSKFKQDIEIMSKLANILSDKRERAGYLDFSKQEIKIQFDNSMPVKIIPRKQLWTEEIIEQFMISANEAVAEKLNSDRTPSIYRTHEEPDTKQLIQFKELVEYLGLNLKSTKREDLSLFLHEIKGLTYERILNYELLRCMKRARYIAQAESHYGLASEFYTHFTSPIRRYPDLVVQRILFGERYSKEELKEIADHSTEKEWNSDEAEREITKYYVLKFLQKNRWKSYRGMVRNIAPNGVFVELDELLINGFLPLKLMPPDEYKMKSHSLKGKRHSFQIGDLLMVKIYTVSPDIGEMILEYSGKVKKFS